MRTNPGFVHIGFDRSSQCIEEDQGHKPVDRDVDEVDAECVNGKHFGEADGEPASNGAQILPMLPTTMAEAPLRPISSPP
jgi:hypothetical protein